MDADPEIDEEDEEVNNVNVLPSFSGGGLPSFSSAGGGGGRAEGSAPSPTLGFSASAGAGVAAGTTPQKAGKKAKRSLSPQISGELDPPAPDSENASPAKKKPKKKKAPGDKKVADKEGGSSAKSPAKGKEAAGKDKDDGEGDVGSSGREREGGERKEAEAGGEVSEEEEEEEDDADEDEKYKNAYRKREALLFNSCSEDEWKRYSAIRQSKFQEASIKTLISQVAGAQVDKSFLFTLGGISKIFVGELMDTARVIRAEWGDSEAEPVQPRHVREAYRRLVNNGSIPAQARSTTTKPRFRR